MQFPVLTYGMALFIYKRQYTDKTLTIIKSMYMRASELRKFSHFYILKRLFLSILCWYFRYFVGTNDMLVGLHVPTKFRKSMGEIAPLLPSGYANVHSKCILPNNPSGNFARHNRFRYIKLNFKYARATGASERLETSCIFVFGECTTNTGNPR